MWLFSPLFYARTNISVGFHFLRVWVRNLSWFVIRGLLISIVFPYSNLFPKFSPLFFRKVDLPWHHCGCVCVCVCVCLCWWAPSCRQCLFFMLVCRDWKGGIPVMGGCGMVMACAWHQICMKMICQKYQANPPHVMPITLKLLSVLPTGDSV